MNIIDHAISLQGSVMQICIALGGFSKKKYFYFQTRCYLFTHHASEWSLFFFFPQKGLFTVLETEITTITKLTATATIIGGVITVTCYCVFHYLLYYDYHNSFTYIMSFNIYSKSERYCYLNFKNEKPKVQRAKSLA